jgi:hypothetical protein
MPAEKQIKVGFRRSIIALFVAIPASEYFDTSLYLSVMS